MSNFLNHLFFKLKILRGKLGSFVDVIRPGILLFDKSQFVLTPDGEKEISQLKEGDEILGYDVIRKKETINRITKFGFFREDKRSFLINGKYLFHAHQSIFANGSVIHVFHLKIGDKIMTPYGGIDTIFKIRKVRSEFLLPRLEIDGDHTYYLNGILVHNANRYWVNGTGTWSGTDTTHWSASSGGAGGASAPTSADDVFFDASSFSGGTGTVTLSGSPRCRTMAWTGATNTPILTGVSTDWQLFGGATLITAMTVNFTGTCRFAATSASWNITSNGNSFLRGNGNGGAITFQGVGGTWVLQDAFQIPSTGAGVTEGLSLTGGTLNTNGQSVTSPGFTTSGTSTRVLTLGATSWTLQRSTGWNISSTTGLTFNANTSTINGSPLSSSQGQVFLGGSLTYNNIVFTVKSGVSSGAIQSNPNITGAFTAANLTINGDANSFSRVQLSANITITGTLTISGSSNVRRILIGSNTYLTARTITAAAVSLTDVDFIDITAAGAASPFTGTKLGNCLGCTNITFTGASNRYWVGNGGYWDDSTHWSTSSGGASGASSPLPQDTAIFDGSSFSSPSQNIDVRCPRIPNLNFTGVAQTPTLRWNDTYSTFRAFELFGSITLVSGMAMNMSANNSFTFFATTALTLTCGTLQWSRPITINLNGGSLTLQDTFVSTSTITLTRGTFSANNQAVTCTQFISSTTTYARTVTMGSNTWELTGTGSVWNVAATNLTVNYNTSTIKISNATSSSKTFAGAGKQYYNIWFTGSGTGALIVSGNNTFNDFKVDTAPKIVQFTFGSTQIVTSFTVSGTSWSAMITLQSTTTNSTWTLSKASGTVDCDYLTIQDSIATGGAVWNAGHNSYDYGNNTGWVFAGIKWVKAKARVKLTDITKTISAKAKIVLTYTNTIQSKARVKKVGQISSGLDQYLNNSNQICGYDGWECYSGLYVGQSFTVGTISKITQIRVMIDRGGSSSVSGNLTLKLYLADANHKPTGSVLGSKTLTPSQVPLSLTISDSSTWSIFTFDNPINVSSSTEYVFVLEAPDTALNPAYWILVDSCQGYTGGTYIDSTDQGSTWTVGSYDLGFEEYYAIEINSPTISAKANIVYTSNKTIQAKARVKSTPQKSIQAKADIKQFGVAKTIQAKGRIKKENSSTIQAKVRLLKTSNKTIQAKARVKKTESPTVQTKARVLKIGSQTIQAKGRIKKTVSPTIQSKARIKQIQSKTIQAKGRIKKIESQTIQSRGRIFKTSDKTIQAKGRIKTLANPVTIQAKARLVFTIPKTIQAKGRIKNTPEKTIQAKADIFKPGITKTIQAKARIGTSINQTVQAKGRIKKVENKTIQAKGRIFNTYSPTVQAKGRIKVPGTETIQAKGRIKTAAVPQTIQTRARVKNTIAQTIQSKGRIKQTANKTIQTKGRIKMPSLTQTIQAKARVKNTLNKTIQAKGRIKQPALEKTIQAKARIKKTGVSQTIQAKANLRGTKTKIIQAKARLKVLGITKTIQTKGRIKQAAISKTIQVKARLKSLKTKTIQAKARVKKTATKTIAAKGRIKNTLTKTISAKAKMWAARLGVTQGKRADYAKTGINSKLRIQDGKRADYAKRGLKTCTSIQPGQRSSSTIKQGIRLVKNG